MAKKVESRKFQDMKKAELQELCDKFNIEVPKKATRAEIIEILRKGTGRPAPRTEAPKEAEDTALTGKARGKLQQLAIREENRASAEKLYADSMETVMHSMDRITPKVYHNKRSFNTSITENTGVREEIPEEVRLLAQSRDNASFTLTGTIEGASSTDYLTDDSGKEIAYVYAIVDFEGLELRIPSYHFWDDFNDKSKYPPNQLYSKMQHRVGAVVDFNLLEASTSEEDGETRYFGTRLLAMKRKRCDYWYGMYPDGTYCVKDGDIVTARVVEADTRHVVVELGGAESKVWISDITKRFINDVEKDTPLAPGSTVRVKLTGIKRKPLPKNLDGFTYPVEFSASIKDAEEDPQIKYFHLYNYGDTRRAYVKNIDTDPGSSDDSNAYYCVISNKPVTVRCVLSEMVSQTGSIPKLGQEVRIRIIKKNKDNCFIYGEIIRIIKPKEKGETAFSV